MDVRLEPLHRTLHEKTVYSSSLVPSLIYRNRPQLKPDTHDNATEGAFIGVLFRLENSFTMAAPLVRNVNGRATRRHLTFEQ